MPQVTFPTSTLPHADPDTMDIYFTWADVSPNVGVTQWRLKVGTSQNYSNICTMGPYPATTVSAPCTMPYHGSLWVKVEYQKGSATWYSSPSQNFQCTT